MADRTIEELEAITQLALGDLYHTVDFSQPTPNLRSRKATHQQIVDLLNASSLLGTTSLVDGAITTPKIEDRAITAVKQAAISQDRIIGKITAGTGDREELTPANVRTIINVEDGADKTAGTHTLWVPVNRMQPDVDAPCGQLFTEKFLPFFLRPNLTSRSFVDSSLRAAQFSFALGKAWDLGPVKFRVVWAGDGAISGTVAWRMELTVMNSGNSFSVDGAFGPFVQLGSTNIASGNTQVLISGFSNDVTFVNAANANDLLYFRIARDPFAANDDYNQTAKLIGVLIFYTTIAGNDD